MHAEGTHPRSDVIRIPQSRQGRRRRTDGHKHPGRSPSRTVQDFWRPEEVISPVLSKAQAMSRISHKPRLCCVVVTAFDSDEQDCIPL